MQKRILSAHCLPRFAAGTFAVFGAAVLIVAALTASTQPAAAQQGFGNFFSYQGRLARNASCASVAPRPARHHPRRQRRHRRAPRRQRRKKEAPRRPDPRDRSTPSSRSPISTSPSTTPRAASRARACRPARRDTARRPGVFSVIGKERWHRSNIYSGAPMPLMQRITWSGVAMHAGVVPGLSGFARLHPPSRRLRAAALRHDQDGRSRRRHAARHRAGRVLASPCCRCRRCSRRRRCRPAVNRRRLPRARSSSPAWATRR